MKAAILIALLLFGCISPSSQRATATLPDGFIITADIADDLLEQSKGLSGRTSLAPNEGMLFIFQTPGRESFWMPDMKFPIDMIFMDENFTVAEVNINAQPCPSRTNCPFYTPTHNVKYVLEVNANQSLQHGVVVGSNLNIQIR